MTCISSGILFADIGCWPISRVPEEGELIPTEKIELNLGGCAANVALNLARLGVETYLTGCVGDDALSDFIVQSVSVPGVEAKLQRSPGRCPGTAIHMNIRDQDKRFICTTGANDDFVFDAAIRDKLSEPDVSGGRKVLYIGGYFMLRSLENEMTASLLQSAQQQGWTVLVDIVLNGERAYWDIIKPILPYVDIFVPNEHEGEKLTDYRDPYDQARMFFGAGVKSTIITQGSGGVLFFSEAEQFQTGVYPTEYVSGSGAGDAFCAGLIAAFLAGLAPLDAIRWGSAAGASCVQGIGTTETVFDRQELLEFIDRHELHVESV